MGELHTPELGDRLLAAEIAAWVGDRLTGRRGTLPAAPRADVLPSIGPAGIGADRAWTALRDVVLPSAVPADHPRYLAFVGGAPSVPAVLADMAVSAAAVYAGSALEAGAVVDAERAALRWLADLAGLPATAHGAFVSGGSMANLSALVTARHAARRPGAPRPDLIVVGSGTHASVQAAADIMGCDVVTAGSGRLTGSAVRAVLAGLDPRRVVAVVATAGATNDGAIDDLRGIADACAAAGVWLHVDAAYGGGALLSSRHRPLFTGLGDADSVTIDPHKWLFTPYDCGAVLYRDPQRARDAHTQTAAYLDAVTGSGADNPADYAVHLTRRARGLPLWMSLVATGTDAYRDAVAACLAVAEHAAAAVAASPHLELAAPPSLSVVVFRRRGWSRPDYRDWSERALREGLGLVTPTTVDGQPALRLCFVNPLTTTDDVDLILGSLAASDLAVAAAAGVRHG